MNLDEVPQGERYIDANIFIYHFSRVSTECRSFLACCESKQLEAFTGTHIWLEVAHRLMILEALHKGLISGGQPARKRKRVLRQLEGKWAHCSLRTRYPHVRFEVLDATMLRE